MRSSTQVIQGFVLAVAAYFTVRFAYDAFTAFALLYDGSLDYGPRISPIARLFAMGPYGRLALCAVIAFLEYAAAILLLAHIVDRLFARDDSAQNSDVFGSAFLLVILNVALSMTAAILAMNAGAMRIAGFEMVATAAAAILADLEHRWRLADALDEFARASKPYFPREEKPVPASSATVHWLTFGRGKSRVES